MFVVPIPENYPLTNQEHAQEVCVVIGLDGELWGVYPSRDRAYKYIKEWERQALSAMTGDSLEQLEQEDRPYMNIRIGGRREPDVVLIDGKAHYLLHRSFYRQ